MGKEEALERRLENAEMALQGLWALLRDLQPPGAQDAGERMMCEFFEKSRTLGAFTRGTFTDAGPNVQGNRRLAADRAWPRMK